MLWRTLCVALRAITAGCGTFATTSDDEHVVVQRLRVADDRRYVFSTNRRDGHDQGDVRLLNDVTEFADGETTNQQVGNTSITEPA